MVKGPILQTLQGESINKKSATNEDEASLDIKPNGVWETRFSNTYFDVKVVKPLAKSWLERLVQLSRAVEEAEARGAYTRSGKFHICTVVFACSGGAGPCATRVMTRIAAKLSGKRN